MPWIFGPHFTGHPRVVEMKELQKFDVFTRAKAFKARSDGFFLNQVNVFSQKEARAPFPWALLTCVGIEMLGSYKFGDSPADRNSHFKKFAEEFHPKFKETYATPDGKIETLSYFLYKGFRNSLAHGFYGKWVFITDDNSKTRTLRYSGYRHFVVLNVYWFYARFRELYDEYFSGVACRHRYIQGPTQDIQSNVP
jgi:hypothetical protein